MTITVNVKCWLFIVYCLLFTLQCLLFYIYCLFFYYILFTVECLLVTVHCEMSWKSWLTLPHILTYDQDWCIYKLLWILNKLVGVIFCKPLSLTNYLMYNQESVKFKLAPSKTQTSVKRLQKTVNLRTKTMAKKAQKLVSNLGSCSHIMAPAATTWLLQPHICFCRHLLPQTQTRWKNMP